MGKATKQDPTGQSMNRRTASVQLRQRLTLAEKQIKAMFRAIPRTRRQETTLTNSVRTPLSLDVLLSSISEAYKEGRDPSALIANAVIPVYDYQLSAAELEQVNASVGRLVNKELLETQTGRMQPNWWWQDRVELPYRQGTAGEIRDYNQLITAEVVKARTAAGIAIQRLEVGNVLLSADYQRALNDVYVSNFAGIKGLSERTAAQVTQTMNAGIQAGMTPTEISKLITERFDVARSGANRTATTEVNKAYNDAKLNAGEIAAKQTGLRSGVLHLSALVITTRTTHAERHGNAYTTAQQRQWWDSGANRINCKCSTRTVLIDSNGKVIDLELQEELKAERNFFDDDDKGTPPKTKAKPKPKKKPRAKPKPKPKPVPKTQAEQYLADSIADPRYANLVKQAGVAQLTPRQRGGAWFQPNDKQIHMANYTPEQQAGRATFRHEYGHYVDDSLGTITLTPEYNQAVLTAEKTLLARDKKFYDANKVAAGIPKGTRYSVRSVTAVWRHVRTQAHNEFVESGQDAYVWGKKNTKKGSPGRLIIAELEKSGSKAADSRVRETIAAVVAAQRADRPIGYVSALWDSGGSYLLKDTYREAGHITDLVSAMTNNKHGGGHSNGYYKSFKRGSIRFGNNLEAFAQVFSLNAADAGPLGRIMVDELAPNLVKIMDDLL